MVGKDDLVKAIDLFKIQGFQTPDELFLVGYIMAHGGELYFLEQIQHDLELIAGNPDFWLPHIKESHEIKMKIAKDDVEKAKSILRTFLETRNAQIPEWLK